jgi:Tol biopolymer transport system component
VAQFKHGKQHGISDVFYEKPLIKGDYLGQPRPRLTPGFFAPGVVSTDKCEFGGTFSPDKTDFYFTRKEDIYSSSYIYHMRQEKEGGRWTVPRPAAFSGKYDDIEPMITADGQRLFFGSDRPLPPDSQTRSTDIWFMDWTKNETHPFIATDESYLIFSSDPRGEKKNKRGLFICFWKSDNTWTSPKSMGRAINEEHGAECPMVTPDGKYLFFSKLGDIYWVDSRVITRLKKQK